VFKNRSASETKGESTRRRVLAAALELFRRKGFERTTMRDIARSCGMSLGAAYHYFPSKDALVEAYGEWMQDEHERRFRAACTPASDLRTRLTALFEEKLDLLRGDRKLLAALYGNLGDASHPRSIFGRKTAGLRGRSLALFGEAVDDPAYSGELRDLLAPLLWLAHLGVFLHFVHDDSRNQARTRKLVGVLVDLTTGAAPLLAHPAAAPVRKRILGLLSGLRPARRSAR
jgi:AcrR family transcriptional regulator